MHTVLSAHRISTTRISTTDGRFSRWAEFSNTIRLGQKHPRPHLISTACNVFHGLKRKIKWYSLRFRFEFENEYDNHSLLSILFGLPFVELCTPRRSFRLSGPSGELSWVILGCHFRGIRSRGWKWKQHSRFKQRIPKFIFPETQVIRRCAYRQDVLPQSDVLDGRTLAVPFSQQEDGLYLSVARLEIWSLLDASKHQQQFEFCQDTFWNGQRGTGCKTASFSTWKSHLRFFYYTEALKKYFSQTESGRQCRAQRWNQASKRVGEDSCGGLIGSHRNEIIPLNRIFAIDWLARLKYPLNCTSSWNSDLRTILNVLDFLQPSHVNWPPRTTPGNRDNY